MSGIPDVAKQWHVKPVGEKTCEQCQCDYATAVTEIIARGLVK